MARLSKIPPELYDEIQKLVGKGLSADKIRIWLEEKTVVVSTPSIQRMLAKWKEERKEEAKRAYANAVAKSANQDLEIIGNIITQFNLQVEKALEEKDLNNANKLSQTLLSYVKTRLDLSGVNDKDKPNDEALTEELMKRLEEYKK